MEKKIMRLVHIRAIVNIVATLIGIAGIVLTNKYPDLVVSVLSIEVILLPAVYIIANQYIEELIKKEYNENLDWISRSADDLEQRYINQLLINTELNMKLRNKNGRRKK